MEREGVPFFRMAMNMSMAHRDRFAELELSNAQREMLEQEATQSLSQQRAIEAADSMSFDEYLRRYFTQSLEAREQALG